MATQLDVYNQAMGKIGQQRQITALGENSAERIQCDRFFEVARQGSLRDWDWPFARKVADLSLSGSTNNTAWTYVYHYPADCLAPRRLLSGEESTVPHPPNIEWIPFEVATDPDDGTLEIYSNEASATLVFTFDQSDPLLWSPDFVDAVGWKLAWYLAVSIAGSEKWAELAATGYAASLTAARTASIRDGIGWVNRDKDSDYGAFTKARF